MPRFRLALTLVLCATVTALFAADDPFNGTWHLNKAKSTYTPGPAPDKAVVTIKSDGVTITAKGESSFEGKPIVTSYSVKLDGTPGPLTGSPIGDMVSVRKVDERTRELKTMKGGQTVSEARAVASADGKTITVTGSGMNPKGEQTKFTAVYEKH